MVERISLNEISDYTRYFPGSQLDLVLRSVAEGNTEAQLWRSIQPNNGIICLLWDKGNNVFYLSGNTITKETTIELASLISTDIREEAVGEGLSHFKIHALLPSCGKVVPQLFQNIQLHKTNMFFYIFHKQRVPVKFTSVLQDVKYTPIDMDFLEKCNYQNTQHIISEVEWMWSSREKFRENGFGYAALLAKHIVCWCTAEYVSKKRCGIGIETIPTYRNKGIATATVAHFISFCQNRDITPHWECDSQNIGSVRVAEKSSFERIQNTIFWSGEFAISRCISRLNTSK